MADSCKGNIALDEKYNTLSKWWESICHLCYIYLSALTIPQSLACTKTPHSFWNGELSYQPACWWMLRYSHWWTWLTQVANLSLPFLHTCAVAVNWVTWSTILTPALWLAVLAIVSCWTRVVAQDTNPSWQTVTGTILLITRCIVKTLAFSFALRTKETFSTSQLATIPLKTRLTPAGKGVRKLKRWKFSRIHCKL